VSAGGPTQATGGGGGSGTGGSPLAIGGRGGSATGGSVNGPLILTGNAAQTSVPPSLPPCSDAAVVTAPPQSGRTLSIRVHVQCSPRPGSLYYLMTKIDNVDASRNPHPEWWPNEAVSSYPGTDQSITHYLPPDSIGTTRHLFVISCDADGVQQLTTARSWPGGPIVDFQRLSGCAIVSDQNETTVLTQDTP
jgi:hypothetical protein